MAEPSPDKIVIGAIGPLITTVIGAAIVRRFTQYLPRTLLGVLDVSQLSGLGRFRLLPICNAMFFLATFVRCSYGHLLQNTLNMRSERKCGELAREGLDD